MVPVAVVRSIPAPPRRPFVPTPVVFVLVLVVFAVPISTPPLVPVPIPTVRVAVIAPPSLMIGPSALAVLLIVPVEHGPVKSERGSSVGGLAAARVRGGGRRRPDEWRLLRSSIPIGRVIRLLPELDPFPRSRRSWLGSNPRSVAVHTAPARSAIPTTSVHTA